MGNKELINIMSNAFREARKSQEKICDAIRLLEIELIETKGTISHDRYIAITLILDSDRIKLIKARSYANGLFNAREILLDNQELIVN